MRIKLLQKKGLTAIPFFYVCLVLCSLLFINTAVLGQSNTDDSNWDNIFSRPESSLAVAVKDADHAYFAGGFRIPHSPVIGGKDEDKYLLSVWDKDHWVLTGKVKEIDYYNGSANLFLIRTAAVDKNSNLFIGGNFQIITLQGDTCDNIARWDGQQWHPLEKGIDGNVNVIAPTGTGEIYIGGLFMNLRDGTKVNNIVKWNGISWSVLGDQSAFGVNGEVYDIAVGNGAVYVGGLFSTAGGNNVNYVASYNWTTLKWGIMADGVNSLVRTVAVYGSDVYIGGDFTETAGHIPVRNVAKYHDTNQTGDQ